MDFKTAVTTCLKDKYASFSGRARRSEYWYFVLFQIVAIIAAFAIGSIISSTVAVLLYCLVALGTICPSISVMVRRLHDTGRSGWWYWITLVPCIGSLILLFFLISDSKEDNEYGPNPKALVEE